MKAADAKAKAREAVEQRSLGYTVHSGDRGEQREFQVADLRNGILSADRVSQSKTNQGEAWEFRGLAEGRQITVVVGFDFGEADVVTAWWGWAQWKAMR
jgi:hypothetical protein